MYCLLCDTTSTPKGLQLAASIPAIEELVPTLTLAASKGQVRDHLHMQMRNEKPALERLVGSGIHLLGHPLVLQQQIWQLESCSHWDLKPLCEKV